MKKILVIHQSAELYGSDKTLLLILSKLDKIQFLPVVVLPSDGPLKAELEKQDIKVYIAPVLKLYRNMFTLKNLIKFFREIKKGVSILDALHKEYSFNIIYSNTLAVLLGMIFARKRRIKHVWHVHEIIVHPKVIATIFPYLLKNYSDVIICNSQATKSNLITRIPSIEIKCTVVHNGLTPPEDYKENPTDAKVKFGFKEEDIIITLVGRINRLKGHKWLLNTYSRFLTKSHAKLLFVGSPVPGQEYYLEEVEQIIRDLNLKDKVTIVPFTRNLEAIWSITDIAIVPSTEAESFGLVALEAMLASKPVIASDAGGLKEIVIHNTTGMLVTVHNEEMLANAINNLVDSPLTRITLGNKGYERAITQFSLEKYVAGVVSVFENVK